jgi:hypothetical protein
VYGCGVRLVEQWDRLEQGLDPRWDEAVLSLRIVDGKARSRAAALLAPAGPGLAGKGLRFQVSRRGAGIGPEAVRRMVRRIDEEGIVGWLELVSSSDAAPAEAEATPTRQSLAAQWEVVLEPVPADWSDLVCALELDSSADLDRAAVLAEPLNPLQEGTGRPNLRFRAARSAGYGTAPGMVRRCAERLDEAGIGGRLRVLQAHSDSRLVQTQGPVWYVGGRTV